MAIGELSAGGTIIGGRVGQRGPQGISITGVEKTGTSGLVDTYTITYSNNTTSTFSVTNGAKGDTGDQGETGNGIESVEYLSTSGLTDTYKITFTDETYTTFSVTNGNGVASISYTSSSGLVDTYTIAYTNGTSTTFNVTNGTTFTPSVDDNGNISWSNDGGKTNPTTKNIKGPTGITPAISIGNVTKGDEAEATITGTTDNPVLNLILPKGDKGNTGATGNGITSIGKTSTSGLVDTYTITYDNGDTETYEVTNGEDGATGAAGVGIVSITKTGTSGLVDTYTITYSDSTTSTFEVTNGEDGEVTEEELDEVKAQVEINSMLENALPHVSGTGTSITLNNTAQYPMKNVLNPSELLQETTTGANKLNFKERTINNYGVVYNCNNKGQVTITGTCNTYVGLGYNMSADKAHIEAGTYVLSKIGESQNIIFYMNGSQRTLPYTFTIDEATDILVEQYLQNGTTYNSNYYLTLSKDTATTERYTGGIPQPNPTYPSDVHVISGDNSIKVQNKNLFDKRSATLISKTIGSNTRYGYKLPKLTQNFYISIQEEITGSFSLYEDIDGTMTARKSFTTTPKDITNSTNDFYIIVTNTTNQTYAQTYLNDNNFMISYLNTTYEPHQEQVKPLNLPVENLFDKLVGYTYAYINSSGVETSDSTNKANVLFNGYIEVKPNKKYILSFSESIFKATYVEYNSSKTFIQRTEKSTNYLGEPITTTANTKYLRISFIYASGQQTTSTIVDRLNIQLEQNSKANSYTPFGTTPIEYCKIGTYSDHFFKAIDGDSIYDTLDSTTKESLTDGKWYIQKRLPKKVLDGSGVSWGSYQNTLYNTTCLSNIGAGVLNTGKNIKGYCNLTDVMVNTNLRYSENDCLGLQFYHITDYWGLSSVTSEALNTFLASKNLILFYPLATPKYIPLNDTLQQQLDDIYYAMLSYQGQTNISQVNNDLPFEITSTALYDLNDLLTRVATLETE